MGMKEYKINSQIFRSTTPMKQFGGIGSRGNILMKNSTANLSPDVNNYSVASSINQSRHAVTAFGNTRRALINSLHNI